MNNQCRHRAFPATFIYLLLLVLVLPSCAPTRRLSEGEQLFVKSKIKVDKKSVDVSTLRKYERLSPNKKVLGVRFHLFLYSLANPEKDKSISGWLRKIGEPPVLYDSALVKNSEKNFIGYLANRGYADAMVDAKILKTHKKARAIYDVSLGKPVIIDNVSYSLEDTAISSIVFSDTTNALVKSGGIFDKIVFQAERERIERHLRNNGYFKFSKEYVFYEITQTDDPYKVNVLVNVTQDLTGAYDPYSKVRKHRQYEVQSVIITPNRRNFEELRIYDTVDYLEHKILYLTTKPIKPATLVGANNILPNRLYNLSDVERTYNDFSTLGLFRYINVSFDEVESSGNIGQLACNIDLAMRKRQSYAVELTVTNSSYDWGLRGGITYNNFNLFKGGEHLQLGVSGAVEQLQRRIGESEPMREIGINSRLETPKFLLPFRAVEFQRKYKPRTEFLLSYNYQNQPKYIRTIVNTSFGYNWRGNVYNKHSLYPVDFSLVKLPYIDTLFIDTTYGGTRLENSFINHTILGIRYGFEFNNQRIKKGRSFVYFLSNLESAGLLVNQFNRMSGWGTDSLFFGVKYFQYIKADIDFRNYNIINPRNRLVYRIFAGAGFPYGNSNSLPFEKMYWSGGPYGIRAWGERTLGPGPYFNAASFNQLGEVKLEGNIEYRFKVLWKLEGALFVDAGNIWLLEDAPELPRSGFNIDTFYEDIAVGTGFGTRFDFSFVLIRLDFGFKLRDPSITEGSKWTFQNSNVNFWQTTFQFGIGYPF